MEKECLAINSAVDSLRYYLSGLAAWLSSLRWVVEVCGRGVVCRSTAEEGWCSGLEGEAGIAAGSNSVITLFYFSDAETWRKGGQVETAGKLSGRWT